MTYKVVLKVGKKEQSRVYHTKVQAEKVKSRLRENLIGWKKQFGKPRQKVSVQLKPLK